MTLEDLGRRAVACKHWRWMPGMLVDGIRIDGTCHFVGGLGKPWREEDFREVICDECVPDLSDPATIGCLLALVRQAWKGNVAPVYPDSDEALAKLVAALEAAP
jgi:hypothetical protein